MIGMPEWRSLEELLARKRESKSLDFKGQFDPDSEGDWCEIIKDIAAFANSGGGALLIGLDNNGRPTGADVTAFLAVDPAIITDKMYSYTSAQFSSFCQEEAEKEGHQVAILQIGPVQYPLLFTRDGSYPNPHNPDHTEFAFRKDKVYFRHGAKSEPAVPQDFVEFIDKQLMDRSQQLLEGVRKVIEAPAGHQVVVVPPSFQVSEDEEAQAVRLTDDPTALGVRGLVDSTAYGSVSDELKGVLKAWRTDTGTTASKVQLWKFYTYREELDLDDEILECLLFSAIRQHAPFHFWASRMQRERLIENLERMVTDDRHLETRAAAKLAFALGGAIGKSLVEQIVRGTKYDTSVGYWVSLRMAYIEGPDRLLKACGFPRVLRYEKNGSTVSIEIANAERAQLMEALNWAVESGDKEHQDMVKGFLDPLVYGSVLAGHAETA